VLSELRPPTDPKPSRAGFPKPMPSAVRRFGARKGKHKGVKEASHCMFLGVNARFIAVRFATDDKYQGYNISNNDDKD
jgi:hypothetical protein